VLEFVVNGGYVKEVHGGSIYLYWWFLVSLRVVVIRLLVPVRLLRDVLLLLTLLLFCRLVTYVFTLVFIASIFSLLLISS
jgi:hypothetical protein